MRSRLYTVIILLFTISTLLNSVEASRYSRVPGSCSSSMKHTSLRDCCCVTKGEETQYNYVSETNYSFPVIVEPQGFEYIFKPFTVPAKPVISSTFYEPLKTIRLLI